MYLYLCHTTATNNMKTYKNKNALVKKLHTIAGKISDIKGHIHDDLDLQQAARSIQAVISKVEQSK